MMLSEFCLQPFCVKVFFSPASLASELNSNRLCVDQDQALHVMNINWNDCCGLGTTMAGIITDGRMAIFEMFTPFKCLIAAASPSCAWTCFMSSFTKTPSPHTAPCTYYHCCLPSGLTVSGLTHDSNIGFHQVSSYHDQGHNCQLPLCVVPP